MQDGYRHCSGLHPVDSANYTVRFATKIYVLHVFQKKSKHGIATPKKDIALIRARLRWAEQLYSGKGKEG